MLRINDHNFARLQGPSDERKRFGEIQSLAVENDATAGRATNDLYRGRSIDCPHRHQTTLFASRELNLRLSRVISHADASRSGLIARFGQCAGDEFAGECSPTHQQIPRAEKIGRWSQPIANANGIEEEMLGDGTDRLKPVAPGDKQPKRQSEKK